MKALNSAHTQKEVSLNDQFYLPAAEQPADFGVNCSRAHQPVKRLNLC